MKRQQKGAKNHPNGANGCQQRPFVDGSMIVRSQQAPEPSNSRKWNDSKDLVEAKLLEEVYNQYNKNTDRTDSHINPKMEKHQYEQEKQKDLTTHQNLSCCTICGGQLAIKTFRQIYHPTSARPIYEWTAQKRGLPPWLYKKIYLAISVKNLEEDPG